MFLLVEIVYVLLKKNDLTDISTYALH